jgi:hypothetical protein
MEPHHAALPTSRNLYVDEPIPWREFTTQVARKHAVTFAALGLIAAQLAWKAAVLGHFFFWQDDFVFFDRAVHSGLTWHYLMKVQGGHLDPGPFALSWVLARISLYSWPLVSSVLLAIELAGCLALLRLLQTLFGNRPAILIPLTVYLLCPLTVPDLVWWSAGIEGLTLQLAIFMSLDTHIRYLRTRRPRYVITTAVWLLVGMLFFDKSVILPVLLFAITSAFFVGGHWPRAAVGAVARYWRAWVVYGALSGGYAALLAVQLTTPGAVPTNQGPPHHVLSFMTSLLKDSFVPGTVGGPWQWFGNGIEAFATPPTALIWLSFIIVATIIALSVLYRRYAWRAWAILAGWILLADMAPIIIGRTDLKNPAFTAFLGLDTHYVADAVPVLVVCLGLAFWPILGQPDQRRSNSMRSSSAQARPMIIGLALGAFAISSVFSVQRYVTSTTSQPGRSYLATAREALAAVPRGTVVVDQLAAPSVMAAILLGPYGYQDQVLGNMAPGKIDWTRTPDGTIPHLKIFTLDGRLWPAGVVGIYSKPRPSGNQCWPARQGTITVPLRGVAAVRNGPWTLRMSYVSSITQQVFVYFGGGRQPLTLKQGLDTAYLPVEGTGNTVVVQSASRGTLCVGNVAVGGLFQNNSETPTPAVPAPG